MRDGKSFMEDGGMTGGIFGSHPVDRWLEKQEAKENEGPPRVVCTGTCGKMADGDEVDENGMCPACSEKHEEEKEEA